MTKDHFRIGYTGRKWSFAILQECQEDKIMSNQVLEAIAKRSSARAYSSEMLTKEELNSILEAGLQAPTGMNRREIHFSVVKGDHPVLDELDTEMRRLRGIEKQGDNFFHQAPVLVLLSAEDGFKWSKVDAGIAVQNMALAAESLGLGSLIIGCIYDALHGDKKEYFSKAFQIPEGYSFEIALAAGHKTDAKIPHDYDAEQQVTIIE
jgi:nitroreductase